MNMYICVNVYKCFIGVEKDVDICGPGFILGTSRQFLWSSVGRRGNPQIFLHYSLYASVLLHWFMGHMTLVLMEGIVLQIFKVYSKDGYWGRKTHGTFEGRKLVYEIPNHPSYFSLKFYFPFLFQQKETKGIISLKVIPNQQNRLPALQVGSAIFSAVIIAEFRPSVEI